MTMTITQSGANVTNDTALSGAPAVRISASRVRLTNTGSGTIASTQDGTAAIHIELSYTDVVIVNEAGGIINGSGFGTARQAIIGGFNGDRIENAGNISGSVALSRGNDLVVNSGTMSDVNMGLDDDVFVELGEAASQLTVNGRDGIDRYVLRGPIGLTNGSGVTEFEVLELDGQITNIVAFSGFSSVLLSAGASHNFLDSANPNATLALTAGSFVTVGANSVFGGATGSAGAEQLGVVGGGQILSAVDLSAGDDAFWYTRGSFGSANEPVVTGGIRGGDGRDVINLSVTRGPAGERWTVDLAPFTGFEIVDTGGFTSVASDVRLINFGGFQGIRADNEGTLVLAQSNAPTVTVSPADNARIVIEATATIGAVGYLPNGMNIDLATVTAARDATSSVVNEGTILGDVKLTTGRDSFDGRSGTVGGTIFGYAGDDVLLGGAGADRIDGGFGADAISGGDGDDVLAGGAGDDVLTGGRGRDAMDGGAGVDTVNYAAEGGPVDVVVNLGAGSSLAVGGSNPGNFTGNTARDSFGDRDTLANIENVRTGAGKDLIIGDENANVIESGAGDDAINASAGNDVVRGGEGDDQLSGGRGNDVLDGGAGVDTVNFDSEVPQVPADAPVAGIVVNLGTAFLNVSGVTTSSVGPNEAQDAFGGRDMLIGIENVTTSRGADTIVGGAGANVLDGGAGNDVARGGAGDDRLIGGDGDDQLSGEAGNDVLEGGAGNDLLLPGLVAGTESAFGGTGDDLLSAGFGAADSAVVMTGGFAADPDGGVSGRIASASGNQKVVFTSVERFGIGGTRFDDALIGGVGPDALSGADGNDAVTGGGGNDALSGGRGDDRLDGGEGSDVLSGDDGADVLDGGAGRDLLDYSRETGPSGVNVNLSGAAVTASPGSPGAGATLGSNEAVDSFGGRDTLIGIEDVRTGALDDRVVGSDGANLLDGGAGGDGLFGLGGNDELRGGADDDYLDGGAGDDRLVGGAGDDFYVVDASGDAVVEAANEGDDFVYASLATYVLAAGVERLESVGDVNHDFRGNALDNEIQMGVGDDFVRLQDGGDDGAEGDAGNDSFYFGSALTALDRVDGGEGANDQVGLQGNYAAGLVLGAGNLIGVETLVLLPGSDARFGDASGALYSYNLVTVDANVAAGQRLIVNTNTLRLSENVVFDGSAEMDGEFLFYGGLGNDVLTGGGRSDSFFFGTGRWGAGDRIVGGAGGDDQVGLQGDYAGANAVVLGAGQLVGVETLVLLTGRDARFGGQSADGYDYDVTANDGNVENGGTLTINGNTLAAGETLRFDGSAEDDSRFDIFSGMGDDVLIGGGLDDEIFGAAGADRMTGGGGGDTFLYLSVADSTSVSQDRLIGFASGDRIDLSGIDANVGTAGDDAFSFIGDRAFGGVAGELRFSRADGGFVVEGDVDGDGVADLAIFVDTAGDLPPQASDFLF